GADEVQCNGVVFVAVVSVCLCADGPHGLGKGWPAECIPGRCHSDARLCRGNRRPCHLGSFGTGLRTVSRQTPPLSQGADAPAQRCPQLCRRGSAVGGLVWI